MRYLVGNDEVGTETGCSIVKDGQSCPVLVPKSGIVLPFKVGTFANGEVPAGLAHRPNDIAVRAVDEEQARATECVRARCVVDTLGVTYRCRMEIR